MRLGLSLLHKQNLSLQIIQNIGAGNGRLFDQLTIGLVYPLLFTENVCEIKIRPQGFIKHGSLIPQVGLIISLDEHHRICAGVERKRDLHSVLVG